MFSKELYEDMLENEDCWFIYDSVRLQAYHIYDASLMDC